MAGTENPQAAQEYIRHHPQVWKFKFYGFFKDLRFFEPYLLIILLAWGYDLLQIGLLVSVREVVMNLFEVPSGMLADAKGNKRVLLLCFVFYIISFGFYFIGQWSFWLLVAASLFFGLGEAYRSGTHKAMMLTWLDREGMPHQKTFLYGLTRSYSLYGSALSALLAIVFYLQLPAVEWIFALSIVPYLIDMVLVASYPDYMNEQHPPEPGKKQNYFAELKAAFKALWISLHSRTLRKVLLSSGAYDGVYKSMKDYIQPLLQMSVALIAVQFALDAEGGEMAVVVLLGLAYMTFNLVSSGATRQSYRILDRAGGDAKRAMDWVFYAFGALLIICGFFVWWNLIWLVIMAYLVIYVVYNARRPLVLDGIGEIVDKAQRVTVISVDAQLTAFFVLVLAPVFGWVAETWSIGHLFLWVGAALVLLNIFVARGK
jgi:MFS family permease